MHGFLKVYGNCVLKSCDGRVLCGSVSENWSGFERHLSNFNGETICYTAPLMIIYGGKQPKSPAGRDQLNQSWHICAIRYLLPKIMTKTKKIKTFESLLLLGTTLNP